MAVEHKIKDAELRAIRQKQILDAAMHVIARRGLPATKIADIAAAAQLSVGIVYKYFTSKEQIFQSLVEMGQREYREFVEAALAKPLAAYDKLKWYTDEWLQLEHGWAITIILQHARTSEAVPSELKQAVSARFLDNLQPMAAIIAQGQDEGTFIHGDAFQLALIYVSLMEGLILHNIPGIGEIAEITAEQAMRLIVAKSG